MQRRTVQYMYPQMQQYPMPMMQASMPMQQAAAVQGGEESDGDADPTQQCKAVKIDQMRL